MSPVVTAPAPYLKPPVVQTPARSYPAISYAKSSKESGKKRATNKPSWVNKDMVDFNKRGEENARIMLDNKYGRGNWKTGARSEFSKIVKWLVRDLGLKSFIALNLLDDVNRVFVWKGI